MPNHSLERTGDSLPSARDGKDLASEKRSRGSDPRPLSSQPETAPVVSLFYRILEEQVVLCLVRRVVEEAKVL